MNTRLTAIGLVKMKCIAKEMCRKENKLRHRDLVNKVFFSRLFFQWMNQESMNHVFAMSLKQESRPSGIETTTNLKESTCYLINGGGGVGLRSIVE